MCDNRSMKNKAINNRNGFVIFEIVMALIVLGFIIRPSLVETCDQWGERSTTVEWELPMAELLDYVSDLEGMIQDTWVNIDADFGQKSGVRSSRKLLRAAARNSLTLATAGFVDQNGQFTGDFSNNMENYQYATEAMAVAFYDSAMEGMAR